MSHSEVAQAKKYDQTGFRTQDLGHRIVRTHDLGHLSLEARHLVHYTSCWFATLQGRAKFQLPTAVGKIYKVSLFYFYKVLFI